MEKETKQNIDVLVKILTEPEPKALLHGELLKKSGLEKGAFEYARREGLRIVKLDRTETEKSEKRGKKKTYLYHLPGNKRLAKEKDVIGSIGDIDKMFLVKDAFREMFMLRLTHHRGDGKLAASMTAIERIHPLLESLKEKNPDFPYSDQIYSTLSTRPYSESDNAICMRYYDAIIRYCSERLRRLGHL